MFLSRTKKVVYQNKLILTNGFSIFEVVLHRISFPLNFKPIWHIYIDKSSFSPRYLVNRKKICLTDENITNKAYVVLWITGLNHIWLESKLCTNTPPWRPYIPLQLDTSFSIGSAQSFGITLYTIFFLSDTFYYLLYMLYKIIRLCRRFINNRLCAIYSR